MLISIIIPMYNAEKYIEDCLKSVKACPVQDIECILINDGSKDNTADVCGRIIKDDDRFRLVNKENSGVSETRNLGLSIALGDYVLFLDADDYINTDAWPVILGHSRDSKYDLVAYGYNSVFSSGRIDKEGFNLDEPESSSLNDAFFALLSSSMLNTCWGKLLRRSVITQNGLVFRKELKTCEDAVFMIDFLERINSSLLCDIEAVYYRINDSGAMRMTSMSSKLEDFSSLFSRRNEFLSSHPDEKLKTAAFREYFSVVTDMFRSLAAVNSIMKLRAIYKEYCRVPPIDAILEGVTSGSLSPIYKKFEFFCMRRRLMLLLAFYFKFKFSVSHH